jgi:hypothetical protein
MLMACSEEGRMSVDRRLLNWGVFLVLLGGVPLAVSQGWIPRDVVARAWELWPLILIGAGIGLILSRTSLRALGGIIVAGTFGVILGGIIAVGFEGLQIGGVGCGAPAADAPEIVREQGSFDSGTGRVILDASCASVGVATTSGTGWTVVVRGSESARPTIDRSAERVAVRSSGQPVAFPFTTQRASWQVDLGRDPRLDLDLTVNAGDATVDLAGATVGTLTLDANAIGDTLLDLSAANVARLDVAANAASIAIELPATADLQGAIVGNAASVQLCAPAGIGLRLLVEDNITASNNYDDRGLVRTGNAWETPGYATAATQVELRTTGNAISYTLDPEGGCQ